MMHVFAARGGALEKIECTGTGLPDDGVWIDVNHPKPEEEKLLESWLGIDIPTREEMQEIEASSRLYEENGALYMTSLVVWKVETDEPANTPVTFIVTPRHLITVRYADPLPFRTFIQRCTKQPRPVGASDTAFIALLETIVDRAADILERIGGDLDAISSQIFRAKHSAKKSGDDAPVDLEDVLKRIGQSNDLATKVRESLLGLQRVVSYFREASDWVQPAMKGHIKTLDRDVRSLNEHDGYLQAKVNFLLDATLGLINIQQNGIIKIFSVAAVIFMPPTLVASIYGMNFKHMPELEFEYGYPMGLALILSSAILSYLFFKSRKWL